MTIPASFVFAQTSVAVEGPDAARLLLSIIPAPPHQPGIGLVAKNTLTCLTALLIEVPAAGSHLAQHISLLGKLSDDSGACIAHPNAMLGLASDYPAWAWFVSASFPYAHRLQSLVGKHLVAALLKEASIEKSFVQKLRKLIKQSHDEILTNQQFEAEVTKLEGQAHQKLLQLLALHSCSTNSAQLSFNAAVTSCLSNRLSSLRQTERQAVDTGQTLSRSELTRTVVLLLDQAQQGHSDDLVTLICLCVGLGLNLGKRIPLVSGESGQGWMAWIDPVAGSTYVDLSFALAGLGKRSSPRHQASTLILKRPLPQGVATMLREAHTQNSQLRTLADLCINKPTSRKKISLPGVHHSASLAGLMNSARSISLATTDRRDISAYATLALELVNKSDLHYVCPREREIWQACSDFYDAVGLGPAVPQSGGNSNLRIGSRLTPSADWIKEVFASAGDELLAKKCGRRYSLPSLIEHHNACARYVGLLMQFVVGGRDRRLIDFRASVWSSTTTFGLMEDKPLSATRGTTPIPIPAALSEQLKLWHAHIAALDKRLLKLQAPGSSAAFQLIRQIRELQNLPMLFLLDTHGAPVPLSSDVLFTGPASQLNRDFGRHSLPDLLLDAGMPFEDIQDWLRHFSPGISTHELNSNRVKYHSTERLISGIDQVLLELNIRPRSGLSKEIAP